MFSFFRKKPTGRARAVLLEDGREISNQAMRSPKFNDYRGPEPMFPMRVRVTDEAGTNWEATMRAGPTTAFHLLPGVQVTVTYRPDRRETVTIDATPEEILHGNPQLKKPG